MGHVGKKTRSLGQMLENPYVCSRGRKEQYPDPTSIRILKPSVRGN